jgi:hypothetical protein
MKTFFWSLSKNTYDHHHMQVAHSLARVGSGLDGSDRVETGSGQILNPRPT